MRQLTNSSEEIYKIIRQLHKKIKKKIQRPFFPPLPLPLPLPLPPPPLRPPPPVAAVSTPAALCAPHLKHVALEAKTLAPG